MKVHSWVMPDILNIEYQSIHGIAHLKIGTAEDTYQNISIQCQDILMFKISNTIDDTYGTFIADVTIYKLMKEEIINCLNKLNYGWRECQYPEEGYHLHAEGATVLDIVFEKLGIENLT